MTLNVLPRQLRRRLLTVGFERRGPWWTGFEIDGEHFGGTYDYRGDGRLRRFLERFPQPGRVLELGSFEGGHTVLLAPHAASVVGVEARADSIKRARYITRVFRIRNVKYVQANVEDTPPNAFGKFDVVFCSGLVYHLPRPWELLQRLSSAAPHAWIWTHYSQAGDEEHEGWRGHWYQEGGLADPLSGVSPRSFWLRQGEIARALGDGGYRDVEFVEVDLNHEHGPAVLISASA